jgi:hypothetical protein
MNAVGSPNIGELGSWSQKPRSPRPIGRDRRQAAPTIRRGDIRRYERTQPLQRHYLAPRLRGLRPDGRARDSYYWPCRYLRSRVAGPDQDRIYYRFLVGTAKRDRRLCPEGTGFARGRGISELDRRSRKGVALDAEPRVRILLPPATSLSQQWTPGLSAKSPALWPRSACGWGRETGRAGCEPVLLGGFSLIGIDAVPPLESSDRVQRMGISVRTCDLINLRAVCAARSSPAADRVRSDASR